MVGLWHKRAVISYKYFTFLRIATLLAHAHNYFPGVHLGGEGAPLPESCPPLETWLPMFFFLCMAAWLYILPNVNMV